MNRRPAGVLLVGCAAVLAVAVAVGLAAVVLGGADDSPGLQLLGVLVVVGALVLAVRGARRRG